MKNNIKKAISYFKKAKIVYKVTTENGTILSDGIFTIETFNRNYQKEIDSLNIPETTTDMADRIIKSIRKDFSKAAILNLSINAKKDLLLNIVKNNDGFLYAVNSDFVKIASSFSDLDCDIYSAKYAGNYDLLMLSSCAQVKCYILPIYHDVNTSISVFLKNIRKEG